jgi:hypothetical protein
MTVTRLLLKAVSSDHSNAGCRGRIFTSVWVCFLYCSMPIGCLLVVLKWSGFGSRGIFSISRYLDPGYKICTDYQTPTTAFSKVPSWLCRCSRPWFFTTAVCTLRAPNRKYLYKQLEGNPLCLGNTVPIITRLPWIAMGGAGMEDLPRFTRSL